MKVIAVVLLLLTGAFLNSKYSCTNAVVDRVIDRSVELVQNTKATVVGLASDVQTEIASK